MDMYGSSIEENPFSEDTMKDFDNHEIVQELICGICYEITVQPQECTTCSQLFCSRCVNDWKNKNKKNVTCVNCKAEDWKLKVPHKIYKKLLSRLIFKCTQPGCIASYTIENYKDHTHQYLSENQIMFDYVKKSKDGFTTELDQTLCKQLEKMYNQKAKFIHYIDNHKVVFDFSDQKSLKGIDQQTNEVFTLVRKQYNTPTLIKKYKWVWYDNDKNTMVQYSVADNEKLENEYLKFIANPEEQFQYVLNTNNAEYAINFQFLIQTRKSSGYKRAIYRCPIIAKKRFIES